MSVGLLSKQNKENVKRAKLQLDQAYRQVEMAIAAGIPVDDQAVRIADLKARLDALLAYDEGQTQWTPQNS